MSTEKKQQNPYDANVSLDTPDSSLLEKADSSETVTEKPTFEFRPYLAVLFLTLLSNFCIIMIVSLNDPLREWIKENVWLNQIAYWGYYMFLVAMFVSPPRYKLIFFLLLMQCTAYNGLYDTFSNGRKNR